MTTFSGMRSAPPVVKTSEACCAARCLLRGAGCELTGTPDAAGAVCGEIGVRGRAVAEDARQLGKVGCVLRQGAHIDRRGSVLARDSARAAVSDVYLDAVGVDGARPVVVRSLNDRGGRIRLAELVEAARHPSSAILEVFEPTPADYALGACCTRGRAAQNGRAVCFERRIALSIGASGDPVARAGAPLRNGWRVRPPIACCSLRYGAHLASAPGHREQGHHVRDSRRRLPHGSTVASLQTRCADGPPNLPRHRRSRRVTAAAPDLDSADFPADPAYGLYARPGACPASSPSRCCIGRRRHDQHRGRPFAKRGCAGRARRRRIANTRSPGRP